MLSPSLAYFTFRPLLLMNPPSTQLHPDHLIPQNSVFRGYICTHTYIKRLHLFINSLSLFLSNHFQKHDPLGYWRGNMGTNIAVVVDISVLLRFDRTSGRARKSI